MRENHHHAIVLLNISRKKRIPMGNERWGRTGGGSKVTDILLYLDIPKLGSIIWIWWVTHPVKELWLRGKYIINNINMLLNILNVSVDSKNELIKFQNILLWFVLGFWHSLSTKYDYDTKGKTQQTLFNSIYSFLKNHKWGHIIIYLEEEKANSSI